MITEREREWMETTRDFATTYGRCARAQVGCSIINGSDEHLSWGVNRALYANEHLLCAADGCLIHEGHCVRHTHAEIEAVIDLYHESYNNDLTAICTHTPCPACIHALAHVGVRRIVVGQAYNPAPVLSVLLAQYGIEMEVMDTA